MKGKREQTYSWLWLPLSGHCSPLSELTPLIGSTVSIWNHSDYKARRRGGVVGFDTIQNENEALTRETTYRKGMSTTQRHNARRSLLMTTENCHWLKMRQLSLNNGSRMLAIVWSTVFICLCVYVAHNKQRGGKHLFCTMNTSLQMELALLIIRAVVVLQSHYNSNTNNKQ